MAGWLNSLFGEDDTQTPPEEDLSAPPGLSLSPAQLDELAAKYPGAAGVRASFNTAIERLKAQRAGLSGREKLGAMLIGFGQPTRHGNFREGIANASQALLQQTMAAREKDAAREALIAKYESQVGPQMIAGATALGKLNAPPKITGDADQRMRLGYAKRLFPNLTDQQIAEQNLLYDPRIDREMFRVYGARAAAAAGEPLDEEPVAAAKPSLEQFLGVARASNPGVSDADLTAYYQKKYGG